MGAAGAKAKHAAAPCKGAVVSKYVVHKLVFGPGKVKQIYCRTDAYLRTYWVVNLLHSFFWRDVDCKKCLKKRERETPWKKGR